MEEITMVDSHLGYYFINSFFVWISSIMEGTLNSACVLHGDSIVY